MTTTTKQRTLAASRTLAVAVGALGFGIVAIATAPLFFGGGPFAYKENSSSQVTTAANYYVDNTVAASGSGTISSPFKTIQEGLNRMVAGDVVWVRGTATGRIYTEVPSFPISGTATSPLTLRAYPGEVVVLTGTSGTRLSFTRDYWILDGITVDQANLGSDAVKITASHIVIRNGEIRNGQREGISIEPGATDITIEDNQIHDFMWIVSGTRNDAHCIMLATNGTATIISNITIQRNTIRRCSGDGTQVYGITGQAFNTYARNISFLNNVFEEGNGGTTGLTENALDFKAADGVTVRGNTMTGYLNNKTIVVQKGSSNFVIEDNTIANGLSGIEMRVEGGSSFIQKNQRVVGNVIHDMSTYAIKLANVQTATIANNTLVNIGAESFRFETTISGVPALDVGFIQNNLSSVAGTPAGTSLLSGVTVGYNGWFGALAGGLSSPTDVTGTNPGFVNTAAKDFHLTSSSPCLDEGISVTGRTFLGSAPDLGAFEYGTTPPDTNTNTNSGGPSGCFTPGTPVNTPEGLRPIGQLRAGDSVYAYDPTTHRTVVSRVSQLLIHPNELYGTVTFSDGSSLEVTSVHRFYNPHTQAWQEIGTLRPGDTILRGLGPTAHPVTIRTMEFTSGHGPVYNLEVDRYHTYYVNGTLVHNAKLKQ
jgi:hypothetical protein